MFDQAKDLHASGKSFVAIAAEIWVGHRTIVKWLEADVRPHGLPASPAGRKRLPPRSSSRAGARHALHKSSEHADRSAHRERALQATVDIKL